MSPTITHERHQQTSTSAAPSRFRADIEGLRAAAVVLVIANHLFGWPGGGFIGVDVFFVISGFLITGLLLNERERTGTISFREFYARRMRRIFPMSTVVLTATVTVGSIVYFTAEARAVAADALWAFIFLENWHLAAEGTDYFHAADAVSPVQQYWSLSVEEQFYLLWPALLVLLWWLPLRWSRLRFRHQRLLPAAVLGVLVAASLTWAVIQTAANPTVAYFSTLTRGWELGVGALLAIVAPRLVQLPQRWRLPLAYAGLAGIAASALLLSETSAFPGPNALFPVLATALVIAAGTASDATGPRVLANPVAGYLGRVSYSLYLWHFPIIVFLFLLVPKQPATYALALVLMLALSAASYRWIEVPIRQSTWLSAGNRSEPWRVRWSRLRSVRWSHLRSVRPSWRAAVLPVLGILLVGLVWHNLGGDSGSRQQAAAPSITLSAATAPEGAAPEAAAPEAAAAEGATGRGDGGISGMQIEIPDPTGQVQAHLTAALANDTWPTLQMPEKWDDWSLAVGGGACYNGWGESRYCTFETPGATKTAVLFGDSQVAAWFPALRDGLINAGYRIEVYYLVGCPVADVPIHTHRPDAPQNLDCESFRAEAINRVTSLTPDLVVVSSFWRQVELAMTGTTSGPDAEQEWQDGMVRTLSAVAPHAANVLVLDSPPGAQSIKKCYTAASTPHDCERDIPELAEAMSGVNSRAVAVVASTDAGVRHLPVEQWFCVGGRCPAILGDMPIYTDGIHTSPVYATFLAPVVAPAVIPPAG